MREPERLYPGDPAPGLPFLDDDWMRFYFDPEEGLTDAVAFEVHETTCQAHSCAYRPDEACPFHPPGCDCSHGACQAITDYDWAQVDASLREAHARI